jgi:ribonuclease Z
MIEEILINGTYGDPGLYVLHQKSGHAVLFDCGDLRALEKRLLLKVKVLCISHAHLDHFIGFDQLIRCQLPHGIDITVCGPEGIAQKVQAKLRGYEWNLIDPKQIQVRVIELNASGQCKEFAIYSDQALIHLQQQPWRSCDSMCFGPTPPTPCQRMIEVDKYFAIDAVVCDHFCPSLSFALQLGEHFKVDMEQVESLGLSPGPWIKELQSNFHQVDQDQTIVIDGKSQKAQELKAAILTSRFPRPLAYVTDILFSEDNLARLKNLLLGVDTFWCETNYADQDAAKAQQKAHLTTKQAASIARQSGCLTLKTFHFSKIYMQQPELDLAAEAQGFFADSYD